MGPPRQRYESYDAVSPVSLSPGWASSSTIRAFPTPLHAWRMRWYLLWALRCYRVSFRALQRLLWVPAMTAGAFVKNGFCVWVTSTHPPAWLTPTHASHSPPLPARASPITTGPTLRTHSPDTVPSPSSTFHCSRITLQPPPNSLSFRRVTSSLPQLWWFPLVLPWCNR